MPGDEWITHTADDEEPDCMKCDHITDNFDCSRKCGPNRGWKGYSREEKAEDAGKKNDKGFLLS